MAPPRRRSCLACVKAKRRCDVALPKCQRCTTKDFPCDYAGVVGSSNSPMASTNRDAGNTASLESPWPTSSNMELVEDAMAPILEQDQHFAQFSNIPWSTTDSDTQHLDLPIDMISVDHITWPTNLRDAEVEEYSNATQLTSEPGTEYITTGAIYHERVRFASQQFQTYPEMFYKRGQAPFIHRQMYNQQTPQVIQDALSSCALYGGKNSENESLVFSTISSKARALVGVELVSMSTIDLLASTQALLLYQIIRLFDGDIRQRADAEADETSLISWTEELLARTRQLISWDPTELSVDALTISSWNDWIFEESCRRIILTSYLLQGVYSFLKFGYDTVSGKVASLSFTAQQALWNGTSEFRWKEALARKNKFQVTIYQWDTAMEGSTPNDIEELGIIVMSCLKGVELTRDWLGKDNLQRWGLE
jgi:Fungal Zn(2)-Cys(6) binuclear cluster domain